MSRRGRCAQAALLAGWVSACGGGGGRSPAAPSVVATPDTGIPAGTVVSVVSGETGLGVPGATLLVGGTSLTSDAAGRVSLPGRVEARAPLDVLAPGYLDRWTLLRSRQETTFVLWPRTSPTGLNEGFTGTIVYTSAAAGEQPYAEDALWRPRDGLTQAVVVLSPELAADEEALARHREAVEEATAATEGRLVYVLGSDAPAGTLRVDVQKNAADSGCSERTRALTYLTGIARGITSARIVYCVDDAPYASTVSHELGHTLGLRHSDNSREVMGVPYQRLRASSFSARETLAVRLMFARRPGNRHPDNERVPEVTSRLAGSLVVACD